MAEIKRQKSLYFRGLTLCAASALLLSGCADAIGPKARNVNIPAPQLAEQRAKAINEKSDPVIYLPLGKDVLVPQTDEGDPLPSKIVGPFELRGETLAGALQLVMDGTNIPVAFETESSLTKTITVTSLKGPMDSVVREICSLGDMYCSYQNGMLVVKDTQVFTVAIPPIVTTENVAALLTNISGAVGSITGTAPITDASTRTIVYRASQRTAELARRYFQRLRSGTALVVFETYVWEVSLDSGNTTGIKWSSVDQIGRLKFGVNVSGAADTNIGSPISIGLPTTGAVNFESAQDVLDFVSSYGAVKTISQPQITVLSGSTAKLRVADKQNYVASLSRTTTDGGTTTVSTTTDSVDSGFTLEIGSNWDNSTVYGNINILLQEVRNIDTFDDNPDAVVQLPQTTERELQTQIRIRPGDLLLIAGLVREKDALTKEGIGLAEPDLPFSRSAKVGNTELVFLLRPRVVVFTPEGETTPRKSPVFASTDPSPAPEPVPAPMPVPVPEAMVAPEIAPAPSAPVMPMAETVKAEPVPLPDNPVSTPVPMAAQVKPQPQLQPQLQPKPFEQVLSEVTPPVEPVKIQILETKEVAPVMAAPKMQAPRMNVSEPVAEQKPAVEINMPEAGQTKKSESSDPSVIVNYDVLGRE